MSCLLHPDPVIPGCALTVEPDECLYERTPRRVLLAGRHARRIAAANPDALVVDAVGQRIWRGPDRVEFSQTKRWNQIFIVCLAVSAAMHRELHLRDLIETLWGDDPDGGPLDADRHVSVLLHQSRPYFRWAGLNVSFPRFFKRISVVAVEREFEAHRSFHISNHGTSPCGVIS